MGQDVISKEALFKKRWSIQLDEPIKVRENKSIEVKPLEIIQRYDNSLVYKANNELYVLIERIISNTPFLIVFKVRKKRYNVSYFTSLPEEISGTLSYACEKIVNNIKVPDNLHNIELDITSILNKAVDFPSDLELSKAFIKLEYGPTSCDCDVEGPCGYCCDTCDTTSSDEIELPDIVINPIEIKIRQ